MTDPRDDAMNDVHALSGAYAIDALDPEERASFEDHLRHCPACRTEVDSLRETTAAVAEDAATEPPPGLRARLLADIETVRPLPPLTAVDTAPSRPATTPRQRGRRRWNLGMSGRQLMLAAAVLAVFMVAGAAWWQPWSDTGGGPMTATEQVLAADDAVQATRTLPDGAEATVVWSRSEGAAVLLTEDMAPAPAGRDYQLWLQNPAGEMAPAGLMPDQRDATVLLEGDATDATAVGITIEPDGGSPQPTSDPIALIELT